MALKAHNRNMYLCFLCENTFPSSKGLIVHLNFSHSKVLFNKFICKQDSCISEFQSIKAFKKHLNKKHPVKQSVSLLNGLDDSISSYNSVPLLFQREPDLFNDKNTEGLENITDISASSFSMSIKDRSSAFVAKLYSDDSVTRSHVQKIVDATQDFLNNGFIDVLKDKVMHELHNSNVSSSVRRDIEDIFDVCLNPFRGLETEYTRFKYFKNSNLFLFPERYVIGHRTEVKKSKGVNKMAVVPVTGEFISVKDTLRLFLNIPYNYNIIKNYMKHIKINQSNISNIIQCGLWKNVQKHFVGKIVIPIFLYFDDFECNNPLGSHAGVHKMGVVYFSLACIPEEFQSLLENLFLSLIFHSYDRVEFGNKSTFRPLIDELKLLETEGFCLENGETVYVSCILILGDNLGVHEIMGFVESFSANHFCRFCTASKSVTARQTTECLNILRSKDNYDYSVSLHDTFETGIKEYCVWNELKSFHVSENLACDIMHDLFEGVCQFDLSKIITHFISSKFFSLNDLNSRLEGFDFGIDSGNRPPSLSKEKLKASKLGYSASETLCIVKHFGLIVGDLIPHDYEHWELYKILSQIVDIVLGSFTVEHVQLLQTLITEHHELYLKLFHETLKPKHHFMVHYPRLMLSIGPLVKVWCMRFESKHRPFKVAANVTNSRINLPYSLAIKHQLKVFSKMLYQSGLENKVTIGPVRANEISNVDVEAEFLYEMVPPIDFATKCFSVSWVKIIGIFYKHNLVLCVGTDKLDPCFVLIENIVIYNENSEKKILFFVRIMETVGFNSHLCAYQVKISLRKKWLSLENLHCKFPTSHYKAADGNAYVIIGYGKTIS